MGKNTQEQEETRTPGGEECNGGETALISRGRKRMVDEATELRLVKEPDFALIFFLAGSNDLLGASDDGENPLRT